MTNLDLGSNPLKEKNYFFLLNIQVADNFNGLLFMFENQVNGS